jgi:antirestriction protein
MSTLNNGVMIAIGNNEDTDTPRAWIGCLGCYNAGRLIGKWIDGIDCDDLQSAGLTDSAGRCNRCGADEFLALDHENFLGLLDGGEPNPRECYDMAVKLDDVADYEREILTAWLSNGMEFDLDTMRECYIGEYATDEDMAQEYIDNTGLLSDVPDYLSRYFDLERYARDMMFDMFEINGHYFMSR